MNFAEIAKAWASKSVSVYFLSFLMARSTAHSRDEKLQGSMQADVQQAPGHVWVQNESAMGSRLV